MSKTTTVGVIGAGIMGSGIAQSLSLAGYSVVCTDISDQALDLARAESETGRFGLGGAVDRGKLTAEEADLARARITWTSEFEAAAQGDLLIETVPERLEVKLDVFRDLDHLAPDHSILATNTSGFPVTAMAGATRRPDRVIAWHWASPAFVMRFAEIVVSDATSEDTREEVVACAKQCGKRPVVIKDNPMVWGFVANRIYGAMLREAANVVEEGTASQEDINTLMIDCFRWPVGPFEMVKGATGGWK